MAQHLNFDAEVSLLSSCRLSYDIMKTIAIVVLSTAVLAVAATVQTPGQIITVPAGGDLQDAIDRAQPGDTITLEAGATYSGNFVLRAKDGNTFITIRTADNEGLPGPDTRVDPSNASSLAKLKSPNSQAVMRTDPNAH